MFDRRIERLASAVPTVRGLDARSHPGPARRALLSTIAIALMATLLSFCAYRERGLEASIEVRVPATSAEGTLEIDRVELLPCPDASGPVATFSLVSIAYAHDQPTGMGPFTLSMPDGAFASTIRMLPGTYCDVRVHFGNASSASLITTMGEASERETVLRLQDENGADVRLSLATAPDRASIRIDLGAFTNDAAPNHALGQVIDGARATLLSE